MPEVGNPVQPCPLKQAEEKPQEPTLHFINFKLLDDKGNPMSDVILKVTLPDGSIEEKTSGKDGLIEIKNITPGNCKITSDWKDYKVDETVFIQ